MGEEIKKMLRNSKTQTDSKTVQIYLFKSVLNKYLEYQEFKLPI